MTRRSTRAAAAFGLVALLCLVRLFLYPASSSLWLVAAAGLAVGAVFVRRPDRRLARLRRGRCGQCNYDLRGTRGRCPECGKLVPPGTPIGRG